MCFSPQRVKSRQVPWGCLRCLISQMVTLAFAPMLFCPVTSCFACLRFSWEFPEGKGLWDTCTAPTLMPTQVSLSPSCHRWACITDQMAGGCEQEACWLFLRLPPRTAESALLSHRPSWNLVLTSQRMAVPKSGQMPLFPSTLLFLVASQAPPESLTGRAKWEQPCHVAPEGPNCAVSKYRKCTFIHCCYILISTVVTACLKLI